MEVGLMIANMDIGRLLTYQCTVAVIPLDMHSHFEYSDVPENRGPDSTCLPIPLLILCLTSAGILTFLTCPVCSRSLSSVLAI